MEGGHLSAEAVGGLGRADVVGAADVLAALRRPPCDRLDLVGPWGAARGRVAREVHDGVGRDDRDERRHDGRAVDLGIGLLDAMAEIGAEARGLREHAQALGLDLRAVGCLRGVGDPERLPTGADLLQIRPRRRGRRIRVTGRRPGRRVEQRGRVTDGERHRVLGGETAEALAEVGRHRVAGTRGLEADEPAARGRGADRAEAVGRVGHRHHARSDRRRGAAARAAGDARRIPRILRRPVEPRLAGE